MAKAFQRFIEKKESGAKKKERIRQDKKKIRAETKAYFDKKKEEKYALRSQANFDPRASERNFRSSSAAPSRQAATGPVKPVNSNKKLTVTKPPTGKIDVGQKPVITKAGATAKPDTSTMPLNKYVAHAGICSRRDAGELVKSGKVFVNGVKIIEPGFKVVRTDDIKVNGKKITAQRNLVYILLNKPKDFLTTTEDPQGRRTVLDIVKSATTERIYPIGRLDRNTTGVLLITNDGELAQKLSHPSYEIRKIYEVTLDRQLAKKDFDAVANGLTLEDGFIQPDALAYPDPKNKHVLGIEIHSGRNRIVRRIFEHLGYDVRGLDRVMYADLTKKNVDRGKWRFLSEKEVRLLKFMNNSYKKKPAQ